MRYLWDDAAKNHLINFLVGTAKGFFFDGTIMLKSDDSENAERMVEREPLRHN